MKQLTLFKSATLCLAFFFAAGCNSSTADKTTDAKPEMTETTATKTDPATLKSEIQERETAWAAADNARDVAALAAFYSEDAVSMANKAPMLVGNAAIKKDIETSLAKRAKGAT